MASCTFSENVPPKNEDSWTEGFYGYRDNILWVAEGCRAEFEVCFKGENLYFVTDELSTYASLPPTVTNKL